MGRRDQLLFRRVVPHAARGAARILTVSERTKRDLVELYAVPPRRSPSPRTASIRPSVRSAPADLRTPRAAEGSESRTSSQWGRSRRRKNQLAALRAAASAGLPLVVVGPTKDDGTAAELREAGALLEGYVPTERLAELYRGAVCLVQASRHEGFGLPMVEAMASGTPVVAVPDPALVEVADGAAIIVAESELGAGIRRAVDERETWVRAGLERVRGLTWDATAEATVAAYVEALAR
jgi:alpha-1,3-rhamnosyl/mannosyltransferase